jgi:hypothetical protein
VQDQLAACTSLYVEDQLGSHFRQLLEFVKKAEQVQKRGGVQDGQPITGAHREGRCGATVCLQVVGRRELPRSSACCLR